MSPSPAHIESRLSDGFAFSDQDFRFLSELVNRRTGIMLPPQKRDMVYSRLTRRLRSLQLPHFRAYCELLQSQEGVEEIDQLVNALTTNLTRFFREPHHFEHLRTEVLEPLVAANPERKRLRIWSAGCSTGMEPYSIAMTVLETPLLAKGWDVKILATDIDTKVLGVARAGEYSLEAAKDIPAPYQKAYLDSRGDTVSIRPQVRDLITFNPLNLLESWPMKGPIDVIFCRNVVIYFDKDTQRTLFSRMEHLMAPKGMLYIGHSENLFNVSTDFSLIGRTIYRRNR